MSFADFEHAMDIAQPLKEEKKTNQPMDQTL
jgi:hypothetical protein